MQGSSSRHSSRAVAGDSRPWKSTATSRSGPIASRTAATRSTAADNSASDSSGRMRPVAFIFTASNPAAIRSRACSAARSGSSPAIHEYTRTLSRTGPPSRSYTGTPSALPLMSHSAWSIPATALVRIGPPR
jgi:hypothetical protein